MDKTLSIITTYTTHSPKGLTEKMIKNSYPSDYENIINRYSPYIKNIELLLGHIMYSTRFNYLETIIREINGGKRNEITNGNCRNIIFIIIKISSYSIYAI